MKVVYWSDILHQWTILLIEKHIKWDICICLLPGDMESSPCPPFSTAQGSIPQSSALFSSSVDEGIDISSGSLPFSMDDTMPCSPSKKFKVWDYGLISSRTGTCFTWGGGGGGWLEYKYYHLNKTNKHEIDFCLGFWKVPERFPVSWCIYCIPWMQSK